MTEACQNDTAEAFAQRERSRPRASALGRPARQGPGPRLVAVNREVTGQVAERQLAEALQEHGAEHDRRSQVGAILQQKPDSIAAEMTLIILIVVGSYLNGALALFG